VSGYKLVDELCDESRFDKKLGSGLQALAEGPVDRGLFTSETSDPNWHKAHNILLPAFSMDAMRGYHPQMLDIAVQLMQKWERLNPDDTVDVPADMTRLTRRTSIHVPASVEDRQARADSSKTPMFPHGIPRT
jgi:cytochrome P450 / NADPH-cytochrome P450 reductase